MLKSLVFLGSTDGWVFSEYYFDKENKEFIERKYHHEYLDTGTVFEGDCTVSGCAVYDLFSKQNNTEVLKAISACCEEL